MPNENENFDDYDFKDTKHRVQIAIKQKKCKDLSPWQVSNFIGRLNTYYYQNELLNTIAIALSNGINPENIIIFDESFKFDRTYSKLSYLSLLDKDLQYLYYIGKPYSLLPNKNVFVMNILFKYFRLLYEFLNKTENAKVIPAKTLHIYYDAYLNNGFNVLIDKLKINISESIKKAKLTEKENIQYNQILTNFENEFNLYSKNDKEIERIKQNIINSKMDVTDFDSPIYKEYFNNFQKLMKTIQRPVVAVINKNNVATILCRAHINKKAKNAVSLKLRSITENSPISGLFEGGLSLYSTIASENRANDLHKLHIQQEESKVEQEKIKLEILQHERDNAITKLKQSQLYLENERSRFEYMKDKEEFINNIKDHNEISSIQEIQNPYIQNQIQDLDNQLRNKTKSLVQNQGFSIDYQKSNINILPDDLYA
ncbi:hypothetical protein OAR97_04760 [Arcobacteraceae bacterium]|nr:hypothetical protein [Arcobacteraceae bacterium]